MTNRLIVRGAREHNLKDVDLDLPRDAMIVFTGLSGSGKSSLAFDTIFAEGQRRYVESLSSYARQFLGQLDKPDVDAIEGLLPAVSIDQKGASASPRSTVGTITEIYDYLRLLWARIGQPHCPVCGEPVGRQTPQQIVDDLLGQPEGARFYLLAPIAPGDEDDEGDGGGYPGLFAGLRAKGYARVQVDGTVYPLAEAPEPTGPGPHTIEVVVDRLTVKASSRQRLTDSVETALKLAGGQMTAAFIDLPAGDPGHVRRYFDHLACPNGHPLAIDELGPRSFSFNSPLGACPVCAGLGTRWETDPGPGRPGREPVAGGRGGRALGRLEGPRVLPAAAAGAADAGGFGLDTPVGPAAGRGAARGTARHRGPGPRQLPHPGRAGPVVLRPFRGRAAVDRAPLRRGRHRRRAPALRGVHAGGAVPGVRRRPAQAGDPRGDGGRPLDRGPGGAAGPTRRRGGWGP